MDRSTRVTRGTLLLLGLVATGVLAACGGGATVGPATSSPATVTDAPAASAPSAGTTAVRIAGFAFDPATVTVAVGSTVSWANQDDAPHTVTWDDGTAGSGSLTKGGAPYSRTFDTPGTFTYACSIHPAMKGSVTVQP